MPTDHRLSPLFYVAYKGYLSIDLYSYLLFLGLDPNNVTVIQSMDMNNTGRMFSEVATKGVAKTGILTIAAMHMSRTSYFDSRFVTNVLPYLIEKGARVDVKDSSGKNCLDYVGELKGRNKQMYDIWASRLKALGKLK